MLSLEQDNLARRMSEAALQTQVMKAAQQLQYKVAHFPQVKKRVLQSSGFPDLVLSRLNRLIFAELKTYEGRPSFEQIEWIGTLNLAGAEVYLWRPQDWYEGTIAETLAR